jgi:hypothetical protein
MMAMMAMMAMMEMMAMMRSGDGLALGEEGGAAA